MEIMECVSGMEVKDYRLDLTEVKKDGDGDGAQFTGSAAVMGNEDLNGDIIDSGAFTRTLKHKKNMVTMLVDHIPSQKTLLGVGKLTETAKALKISGHINMDKQLGKDTLSDLQFFKEHGMPLGLSIGFETVKSSMDEQGIRHLKEIKLWETSVVIFPANTRALVQGVKSVLPFQSLSLSDEDTKWQAAAAIQRIREWAGATDEPNAKFRRAFIWYDTDNPDLFSSYKLPIADVVEGKLTAIPRGIFAAAAALQGARGGVDIPDADMPRARAHLSRYYRLLDRTPPWDQENGLTSALGGVIDIASTVSQAEAKAAETQTMIAQAVKTLQALQGDADPAPRHSAPAVGPGSGDNYSAKAVDDHGAFLRQLQADIAKLEVSSHV